MAERQSSSNNGKSNASPSIEDLWNKPQTHPGIIDGNFLSVALCGALLVSDIFKLLRAFNWNEYFFVCAKVILTVAVYAFYSLYHAVLKKFPSHHTEL